MNTHLARANVDTSPPLRTLAQRGFTLLELLVVMALVTFGTSALAVALHRSLPGAQVSSASHEIVRTVREARTRARESGLPVYVRLDEAGRVLTVTEPSPGSAGAAVPESVKPRIELSDWAGRPVHRLAVFPDGSTTGARFLIRRGAHERSVLVSELTGRIQVERP